ncbi:MAG TPA: thioredoxin domain-containing protein [Alphaproteobacteria bacterium]|nr:thioredoxin domain-containing protein [Alphaproteobacteria bacterium]
MSQDLAPQDPTTQNLLGRETSPYLLQHKDNPVHWQPWGDHALAEAKRLDRPILLSIGYAACHWCHVMAHESFEDPETAAIMNALYVNIKIDREERPDIDTIYQHALALLGEHGGWPLTMFCTPEGEPFWGGTYFPPDARYGRPAFRDVLNRISEVYRQEKHTVHRNVSALREGLERLGQSHAGQGFPQATIADAARRLLRMVDLHDGGIAGAPKFPQVPIFKLFWRLWKRSGDRAFRDAVLVTLVRMSQGGIYDHLGGGFARYSTDDRWLAPHFEKMLYDNAQLIELLADAWLDTHNPLFETRAVETVDWVLREMISPDGGFAATQDADSEGHEGRFYVWSAGEIERLLGDDAVFFKRTYDVTADGNWEGVNILNRIGADGLLEPALEAKLAQLRKTLWRHRETRVKPGWDDKVLADWNGLMIAALVRAGLAFDKPEWVAAAASTFAFVSRRMSANGRLRHSYRAGQLKHAGSLDDHANMVDAALMLYEATTEPDYLRLAESWVEILDRHYRDTESGGYFFTADDVTDVIVRTKSASDNATPSGNGTMAASLARLYYHTGKVQYRERADAVLSAFSGQLGDNIFSFATLLGAAALHDNAIQVVLAGTPGDPAFEALRRAAYGVSQPNRLVQIVSPGISLPAEHPAHGKGLHDGKPTAYVCTGRTCSLPITSTDGLRMALGPVAHVPTS